MDYTKEKLERLKEYIIKLDLLSEENKKIKKWQIWKLFKVLFLIKQLDKLNKEYNDVLK